LFCDPAYAPQTAFCHTAGMSVPPVASAMRGQERRYRPRFQPPDRGLADDEQQACAAAAPVGTRFGLERPFAICEADLSFDSRTGGRAGYVLVAIARAGEFGGPLGMRGRPQPLAAARAAIGEGRLPGRPIQCGFPPVC
jgi:hypothetical protein